MTLQIRKAERKQKKARIALVGPSGAGKTWSALELAQGLADGGRVLLLDTEKGSSTLYAEKFDFDVADLDDYEWDTFMNGISLAAKSGYDVLVIDSLSHAWEGLLELHEMEAAKTKNSFTAWAKVTPKYNDLISAITSFPGHVVVTMRAKTEYVIDDNNGKKVPRKVGLASVMRPGSEYEFDIVALLDIEHNLFVEKTRLDWLADKSFKKPSAELGKKIREWLMSGKSEVTKYSLALVPEDKREAAQKHFEEKLGLKALGEGVYLSPKPIANLESYRVNEQ